MALQKITNLKSYLNLNFKLERSANFDLYQSRSIFKRKEHIKKVAELFRWRFGNSLSILETDFESAELIKYMANTFFALNLLNDMKILR